MSITSPDRQGTKESQNKTGRVTKKTCCMLVGFSEIFPGFTKKLAAEIISWFSICGQRASHTVNLYAFSDKKKRGKLCTESIKFTRHN